MEFDVLLRNGTVIDGTGSRRFTADIGVMGDSITAIGCLSDASANSEVDCSSLVVTPGFIDIHTHYDAPILWDPQLTPSSWFGVTTVLFGNCGFSVAPCRSDASSRRTTLGILETAEGMSRDVLAAGVTWGFTSFPEYLETVRGLTPTLNVGALVGHSALRSFVLGDEAFERAATEEETSAMCDVLAEAVEAGAFGFSSARSSHVAFGKPVPSRLADKAELRALASTLRRAGAGMLQIIGGSDLDVAGFAQLAELSGRPVTWSPLRTRPRTGAHWQQLRWTESYQETGLDLWPQAGCEPVAVQFSFMEPLMIEAIPSFARLHGASREQRYEALSDHAWRAATAQQMLDNELMDCAFDRITVVASPNAPDMDGRLVSHIAEELNVGPFDAMARLALHDCLETRFEMTILDYLEDEVGRLLERPSVLVGLSDAGAHQDQLCDAGYACRLLGHWARDRRQFPLETAVWKLTGQPAETFRLSDRGRLRIGAKADICVLDPATVGEGDLVRVNDLPGSGTRLVRAALGVMHVLVNGQFIKRSGEPTEMRPGTLVAPMS